MSTDLAALASDLSPYATAAISAYGSAVLTRSQDEAADATVRFGQKILKRIFRDDSPQKGTPKVVEELAADPGNTDLQAVLRVAIIKELKSNTELAAEVCNLMAEAPPASGVVNVAAYGKRSVSSVVIHGDVTTGDTHHSDRG
ncbi:hypothetical protein [Nonomuraea indica]|uniref:Uncharacterized protein n=1 Tax=Nonomuraea indica TaxID=1581193 RepID=A0ABW7ZY45_9ACTN